MTHPFSSDSTLSSNEQPKGQPLSLFRPGWNTATEPHLRLVRPLRIEPDSQSPELVDKVPPPEAVASQQPSGDQACNLHPPSDFEKTLSTQTLQQLDTFKLTDTGQAEAFSYLFADRLHYISDVRKWLIWLESGHHWYVDHESTIVQYVIKAARARQAAIALSSGYSYTSREQLVRRQTAENRAEKLESLTKIKAVTAIAATMQGICIGIDKLDTHKNLLGVANGVIDLKTGIIRPGQREDLITHSTNIHYAPDSSAPRWIQFLTEIFQANQELISFIQRAVGYSITGSMSEQVFFICHGPGSDGKSVFLNILQLIGGDYAVNTPIQTFQSGMQTTIGNDVLRLRSKRIVTASEIEKDTSLNAGRIKALTGGDLVTGRGLYLDFSRASDFYPEAHIWLATNYLPTIATDDKGMWRRVIVLEFTKEFGEAEKDLELFEVLKSERGGILAWAIEGATKWYQEGLCIPESVRKAITEYRNQGDWLSDFLTECAIIDEESSVGAGEIQNAYRAWAFKEGTRPVSTQELSRVLQGRGFPKTRGSVSRAYEYHGLRLQ